MGSFTRNPAVLTDPGQPASDWALSFTVDAASGFYVEARAADAAGLTDQSKARVSFQVSDQTDAAAPTGTVTAPTNGASVQSPVSITGTADDDVAVAQVRLGIKRASTGEWWNGSTWQGSWATVEADLASPGAASTTWSYTFDAPATGDYGFATMITDTAGKSASGADKPGWVSFTVADEIVTDDASPSGTVTAPANGALVGSPVSITGTADDDVAVAQVRLGIKRASTGEWWNGSTWQGSWATVEADLASPGAASTTWSYTFDAPATGDYGFATMITDTAGKSASGADKPGWTQFTVVP